MSGAEAGAAAPSEQEAMEALRRAAAGEVPGGGAPRAGEYIPRGTAGVEGVEGFTIDVDPRELLADTEELFLSMLAPYWLSKEVPEEVRITRAKIEKLAAGHVALLMKYLPLLLEKYPLELACVVQAVTVFMPLVKAGVPMRAPKPKPDDDKTTANNRDG